MYTASHVYEREPRIWRERYFCEQRHPTRQFHTFFKKNALIPNAPTPICRNTCEWMIAEQHYAYLRHITPNPTHTHERTHTHTIYIQEYMRTSDTLHQTLHTHTHTHTHKNIRTGIYAYLRHITPC